MHEVNCSCWAYSMHVIFTCCNKAKTLTCCVPFIVLAAPIYSVIFRVFPSQLVRNTFMESYKCMVYNVNRWQDKLRHEMCSEKDAHILKRYIDLSFLPRKLLKRMLTVCLHMWTCRSFLNIYHWLHGRESFFRRLYLLRHSKFPGFLEQV